MFFTAYESKLITYYDCERTSIVVEDKYIVRRTKGSGVLYVVSCGEKYSFPETNYSTNDLYDMIPIGETINILYIESSGIGEEHYQIVDGRHSNNIYVDINDYNNDTKTGNVISIIAFSILEIIFLYLSHIGVFLDDMKTFYKKLNKKIKKLKKLKVAKNTTNT
jgi:hypothetical protein